MARFSGNIFGAENMENESVEWKSLNDLFLEMIGW